ncbi:3-oxoacyl-ACP synthase [Marinifilum caeruleilacunae]|uniref:3-oxoacyl-ACP synthase n=1 Tax=Marinifilum caeruleilacunae TaxID=2499076 RepID=A0ABX1WQU7_9BACT|nr:3-oxoacyl-ACP synthase [Marinifilum caeruleilacunae]NOU58469.1 3-oxoacyl-ACP synthase [Marinifilum caeruleilacunae]
MEKNIKLDLYKLAKTLIESKINENKLAIASLKESVGSESKSTAGDKHETGRAMMHIEQEKVMRQLANNQKLMALLDRVDPELVNKNIQLGTLVITNDIRFYIIGGLGQLELHGKNYLLVSFQSDLVQAFKGKKEGDLVQFKDKSYAIEQLL